MSEIAKCPLCGKDVKRSIWRPEYEGCAGSVVVTVKCCGMEALTVELWNQYAAAIELAEAKAWQQEVWEALRKPWDFVQVLRERKSIESICDIFEKSEVDAKSAEKRVLEVFK